MKFLRVVHLDGSDRRIYDRVAEAGEWAVPGTFALWDLNPETLAGPALQAFGHGFLGTASLGWASLVSVAEMGPEERERVVERLTGHLVRGFGAPDAEAARPVAEDEVDLTAGLCEHPPGTVIAVDREVTEEGIVESFRVVRHPRGPEAPFG